MHYDTSLLISRVYIMSGFVALAAQDEIEARGVEWLLGSEILTRRIRTSSSGVFGSLRLTKSASAVCMARIMILENQFLRCKGDETHALPEYYSRLCPL